MLAAITTQSALYATQDWPLRTGPVALGHLSSLLSLSQLTAERTRWSLHLAEHLQVKNNICKSNVESVSKNLLP